jgi:hypothetical protein
VEGNKRWAPILTAICIVVLCLLTVIWPNQTRDRRQLELHGIAPEALHALLTSEQEILLFDVRQPLDLLANSAIILSATRIRPRELLENPLLVPKEKDAVVYCACPVPVIERAESSCVELKACNSCE